MKKIEFTYCGHFEYRGYIVNEVYVPMPRRQHGAVVSNEDGSFTAFLDPADSYEMQLEGIKHELDDHLQGHDLEDIRNKDANQLEMAAHHQKERLAEYARQIEEERKRQEEEQEKKEAEKRKKRLRRMWAKEKRAMELERRELEGVYYLLHGHNPPF